MARENEPQIRARLNEAVAQATSQFETAAARSADRRYQLMLENTQALTQEALGRPVITTLKDGHVVAVESLAGRTPEDAGDWRAYKLAAFNLINKSN